MKKVDDRPMCRHCNAKRANRTKGLCWSCFYRPGVREQYGALSKFGVQGVGANVAGGYRLPEPTKELPGTPEKAAVLAARAKAGEALHHPRDGRRT